MSGVTWQLDSELSVYPEFHGGISQKEYFTEFDEDGNPIETEEKPMRAMPRKTNLIAAQSIFTMPFYQKKIAMENR